MSSERENILVWVNEDLTACLLCSGQAGNEVEEELTFAGPDRLPAVFYLDQCLTCGCRYGYLDDLEYFLEAVDWEASDVEDVYRREHPLDVFIALGAPFGVIPWTAYRDLLLKAQEEAMKPKAPPPATEAVLALPVRTEAWELGVRVADWVSTDDDTPVLSFFAVVVNEAAAIRQTDLVPDVPPDAPRLAELVLRATTQSDLDDAPCRPLEVLIDDAPMAQALHTQLQAAAIPVRAAPTPHSDEVLALAVEAIRRSARPPYLVDYPQAEVVAFMEAAGAFYRLHPWERLDGNRFVGFRFDEGPWRYLNVMGQMQEEYGLSLFDDWLQLCRFIHNQPSMIESMLDGEAQMKPLLAAGALEGIALDELHLLNPDDAVYLRDAGLAPLTLDELELTGYPMPRRFGPEGVEPPLRSLSFYRALMQGLTAILSRRKAKKISSIKKSVSIDDRTLTLRYPARGLEDIEAADKWFTMLIAGEPGTEGGDTLASDLRIVIDAPGAASLFDISEAIEQEAGNDFRMIGLFSEGICLWSDEPGRSAPAPHLEQLQDLPDLTVDFIEEAYPLRVMRLNNPVASSLQVRIEQVD